LDQQALLKKAAGRWLFRRLARAYVTWEQFAQEKKAQFLAIRRAMGRWKNRQVSAALQSWMAWYDQQKWQQQAMNRASMRWLKRGLARGFSSWQVWYQVRKRRFYLLNKAARSMKNIKLAAAFRTWDEMLEELFRRGMLRSQMERYEMEHGKHAKHTAEMQAELEKVRRQRLEQEERLRQAEAARQAVEAQHDSIMTLHATLEKEVDFKNNEITELGSWTGKMDLIKAKYLAMIFNRIKVYHTKMAIWAWKCNHEKHNVDQVHPLAKILNAHTEKERRVMDLFLKDVLAL